MRSALEMVEEELPVVPDLSLASNAQILLDACHGAGLLDWSIALALALENTLLLNGNFHCLWCFTWFPIQMGVFK